MSEDLYIPLEAEATYEALPGSPDVRQLEHPTLGMWVAYRKTLRPRYITVWFDIGLCFVMMTGGFAAHIVITSIRGNIFGLEVGAFFALWIGFWLNAILTFGHEAAHYNLAPSRARNDILADWTIWLFFPESTKNYRRSHWQHHLHLGDPQDTEISYHNCLSPWFLARALTGIYLLELVSRYIFRRGTHSSLQRAPRSTPRGSTANRVAPALRTMAVHSIFIGVAVAFHAYASALVWMIAIVFVFPFFASIRQILEHRAADAACSMDFGQVPQGPVNRTFGTDLFSRYFGAAGFNRHLLHHWDPTVSYTRFDEMQIFFNGTHLHGWLERAQSSYAATFAALLRKARNEGA
jgi:fatty acid desaturase